MAALSPEKVYLTAAALLAVASAAVCGTFSRRQMTAPRAQDAALD
jgi:hypothetical protein